MKTILGLKWIFFELNLMKKNVLGLCPYSRNVPLHEPELGDF